MNENPLKTALVEVLKNAEATVLSTKAALEILEGEPDLEPSQAKSVEGLRILAKQSYVKTTDGKLTLYGSEILYRMFDCGLNRYQAALAMDISYRASALRYESWQALGEHERPRPF